MPFYRVCKIGILDSVDVTSAPNMTFFQFQGEAGNWRLDRTLFDPNRSISRAAQNHIGSRIGLVRHYVDDDIASEDAIENLCCGFFLAPLSGDEFTCD